MEEQLQEKYEKWNKRKQFLEQATITEKIYFKERDIWWCALGINLGSESFGKGEYFRRPILILKKLSSDLCIALPLTSKKKEGSWFIDIDIDNEIRYLMLYQIRTIHKKRFQYKITQLNKVDFSRVKEKLKILLELF
jgi:mRNA interferase MazF